MPNSLISAENNLISDKNNLLSPDKNLISDKNNLINPTYLNQELELIKTVPDENGFLEMTTESVQPSVTSSTVNSGAPSATEPVSKLNPTNVGIGLAGAATLGLGAYAAKKLYQRHKEKKKARDMSVPSLKALTDAGANLSHASYYQDLFSHNNHSGEGFYSTVKQAAKDANPFIKYGSKLGEVANTAKNAASKASQVAQQAPEVVRGAVNSTADQLKDAVKDTVVQKVCDKGSEVLGKVADSTQAKFAAESAARSAAWHDKVSDVAKGISEGAGKVTHGLIKSSPFGMVATAVAGLTKH